MNLVCWIFGHKPPQYAESKGWGGWEYCDLKNARQDGTGRTHVYIYGDCARCEQRFRIGAAHLPPSMARTPGYKVILTSMKHAGD